MHPRVLAILFLLSLSLPAASVQAVSGVHYGTGNLPSGCSGSHDLVPGVSGLPQPAFNDGCYTCARG